MLTAKQRELLVFIQRKLEDSGISPSFEEMKEALDLKSKSGVHRLISALEERGFIRRLPNRARALEVLKEPDDVAAVRSSARAANDAVGAVVTPPRAAPQAANDVVEVPLHGKIAAGAPIEALEDYTSLPVPAALLGAGEHYALEVSGDSMIEAGILDGDFALIRKTSAARDGEIVVALIRNEEATLKYLRHEGGKIRILATSGAKRSPLAPQLPTFKEQGLPLVATGWNHFFAPASTPRASVDLFSKAISQIMAEPDTRAKFLAAKMLPVSMDAAQTAAHLQAFNAQWESVIRRSGFKGEA